LPTHLPIAFADAFADKEPLSAASEPALFFHAASLYGLTRMQLSISLRPDFQWRHLLSRINFLS